MLKLTVIGRLGRDAEIKEFKDKKVIDFSVASSQRSKNQPEKTIWINCSYWTEFTNIAQYLKKGIQVYIEGSPDITIYTKDNIPSTSWRMRVTMIELLGSKNDVLSPGVVPSSNDENQPMKQSVSGDGTENPNEEDDLPF